MRILRVSEFIEIINGILRETLSGEVFAVEGEVSGYRVSQGQWVNFDLKDEKALLNIFMPLWQLNVPVEDGLRVRVFGLPRIYPKYGKFSISAERIELAGEGVLRQALAALRVRLAQEGLFDPARKRLLPRFPQRIALIASRESAAYGDFIRVVGERWGGLEIDLYHVLVQGDRAPQEIVQAIQAVNSTPSPLLLNQEEVVRGRSYDALVLTRGGGSLEELMAFNDERVVRAIHGSHIPTLVAIGHERDLALVEEAADVRGSTPTDCARRLVPDRRDVSYEVATLTDSIEAAVLARLERWSAWLERALAAPGAWVLSRRAQLELLSSRCSTGVRQWLRSLQDQLQSHLRLLTSLDPKGVLARGYSILRDATGRTISSIRLIQIGGSMTITVQDGVADATITRVGKK